MSILGLDLSLAETGMCYIASDPIDDTGIDLIKTKGHKGDSFATRFKRIAHVTEIVMSVAPGAKLAVIEGPSYGSASKGTSFYDRAGLFWHVYGAIEDYGIPVAICPPTTRAKYATGSGTSDKDKVLVAAAKRYWQFDINNNNVADAVVMAAMGARHLGTPFDPVELSKPCLDAMNGVEWP